MHFFLNQSKSKKGSIQPKKEVSHRTGPLTCPKQSLYPKQIIYKKKQTNHTNLNSKFFSKRSVLFFSSFHGSITAEATLAVPLFLAFCIQLISIINIIQLHSYLEAALHQVVSQASIYAYLGSDIGIKTGSLQGFILEQTYLKTKIIETAGVDYLNHSMIENGSSGIHVELIPVEENQDVVDIMISYKVKPVIDLLGFSKLTLGNRCKMKIWNGYQHKEDSPLPEEEWVYITETGTVYHKNRNCTHLSLSIRAIQKDLLTGIRNDNGAKYYPCEMCNKKQTSEVFLTDQGNRYHSDLNCSGLKRTVYVVLLSQAGGKSACSRCGNTA